MDNPQTTKKTWRAYAVAPFLIFYFVGAGLEKVFSWMDKGFDEWKR